MMLSLDVVTLQNCTQIICMQFAITGIRPRLHKQFVACDDDAFFLENMKLGKFFSRVFSLQFFQLSRHDNFQRNCIMYHCKPKIAWIVVVSLMVYLGVVIWIGARFSRIQISKGCISDATMF